MIPFEDLLFPGSPFVPTITQSSVDEVLEMVLKSGFPPYFALAHVVAEIGIHQATTLGNSIDKIKKQFSTSESEIADFLFGHIIACQFLESILIFQRHGPQKAIKSLCPPTSNGENQRFNQYKAINIQKAVEIYEKFNHNGTHAVPQKIYEFCVAEPYSDDYYFQAGIEESRQTYFKLLDMTVAPPY